MQRIYEFRLFRVDKVEPFINRSQGFSCPVPRSGHRIVADSANIYSFGGYNPQAPLSIEDEQYIQDFIWIDQCLLFKELWKFNIATRTWKKLRTKGTMPEELASHSALLLGDNLLVFGGTSLPFGLQRSNKLHLCKLNTLEWDEVKANGEEPLQQYGQAVTVYDRKLYTIGGTTGYEYTMDVHCLDLQTCNWQECAGLPQPEARYRHEIVAHNGKIFVFGGGTKVESFDLMKLPAFDIQNKTWDILSTTSNELKYPDARRCHGCVQIDNCVFICGGNNNSTIYADIWMINLNTLTWYELPCKIPKPLFFHSSTVTPAGKMFIFGGVTNAADNIRVNKTYCAWIKIPSLREMCWEAILYYVPYIGCLDKLQLLSLGIPRHLLERIDSIN